MLRTITPVAVLAAAGALAGSLVAGGAAAPKPGFAPGTWIGKGTISGRSSEGGGPMTTFSGAFDFVLRAAPNGHVSGSGTWSRTMVGSGTVSARIVANTRVNVAGSATAPRLVGAYRAKATFSSDGVTRSSTFAPVKLDETLVIARAGKCRITGRHTFRGVTTEWSAQLEGSGTCRA